MDLTDPDILSNILSDGEKQLVPLEIQDKLKNYLEDFFDDYRRNKAAANRLDDYHQQTEDCHTRIQELESKLLAYEQNVTELRTQLDSSNGERTRLLSLANEYEAQLTSLRQEKQSLTDERDSLLKVIERRNFEIERLQDEIRGQQAQLKNAINAKCEALARIDDIESKETALKFKEKRMEQERTLLESQIHTISEDLNRSMLELQNVRREYSVKAIQLETKLTEKLEELKIKQNECDNLRESNEKLNETIQELSAKMLSQSEENNKVVEYYKKEVDAKSKLADLYKSNCDDAAFERSELATALTDLKKMLAEASDQYGGLETKYKATIVQHEQELQEKNKLIDSLKSEIAHANDLLKTMQEESVEKAVSKIAPTAAIASRLIRSDMSLTELYSLYVKTSEELDAQKRENSRLNLNMKTILHELHENAPVIKKQETDYEKLLETHNLVVHQRDELLQKKAELEATITDAHSKINFLERDARKLKLAQNDLSRQVCYLLKEVEQLRDGIATDNKPSQVGSLTTTDEIISKKLVTFADITELQANNQKLLLLVRDLSNKLEETEMDMGKASQTAFEEKLEGFMKRFQHMQETLNNQNATITTLQGKCDRYRKLYFDLSKQMSKGDVTLESMDLDDKEEDNEKSNASKSRDMEIAAEKRVNDLEQQLKDVKEEYRRLKEQHEYYCREKKNNEKLMNEQFDSMRTEVRELTSTNCKLMSTLEYTKEQLKLLQKNMNTYKQQISTLEDRNKNYETTIIKHEQTVHFLKDEVMKAQRGLSAAESELHHLKHENRILKDTAGRLQSEKEFYIREQQGHNLLLNNIEMIKSNLERSEMEGRARLEQRVEETLRELSAQRRRFQEEEDRFRETVNELQRQTESAKHNLQEEKVAANKLRTELMNVREELLAKSSQIDDLSKKLQESLTPSKTDNPLKVANKRVRELEIKLEEAAIDIASLKDDLAKAREHADQYCRMAHSAENEIKSLHEVHSAFVKNSEQTMNAMRASELNLKAKIAELETEVQLNAVPTTVGGPAQSDDIVKKAQIDLKDALRKLQESNSNLRTLREENTELSATLNSVETKYANEMVLHSNDIKELTRLKSELSKVQDEIDNLKCERDSAMAAHKDLKESHQSSMRMLENEKTALEKRIDGLNKLNASLHDQIEALASKLSTLTQTQVNNSLNESTEGSVSELNRSQIEEDNKNADQLLQIIKFLRKEKDVTLAKVDILKAENTRLVSEHTILQKKLDELTRCLDQERSKSDTSIVSASKHEEILRKIETLNAVTDSNRILREERNSLAARIKELNDHISKVEDELLPLRNQNCELTGRVEELSTENTSLRTEAIKWRQRANLLVEKSNKNPEEFKRLQLERENLAKMLTSEKEQFRQLQEQLESIRVDKMHQDSELQALRSQLQTLTDEKRKLTEDLAAVRVSNARLMQEVMELKNKLLQKEDALQKVSETLEKKEVQLTDSKNKEMQIRKIAKRYKDSFMELSNKMASSSEDANPSASATNSNLTNSQEPSDLMANFPAEGMSADEDRSENKTILTDLKEKNEKLIKEIGELRAAMEAEEHSKNKLIDAKTRIASLTDSNISLTRELNSAKSQLQAVLEANEDNNASVRDMKKHYEENASRLEKELQDNKDTIARLLRENESLQMRNNQLRSQVGLPQSAKPSTSSVTITDKSNLSESSPRTANVKPMSGSSATQQSATVTPWRGSETPLASIRPISVQNSRTAAILPTSQQSSAGTSSNAQSNPGSNTALVPPQQQVHTTGTTSAETISSSPTSSHSDYIPSTSSASVVVAAIPPLGSTTAESSVESEAQQIEIPIIGSGGQQQVVALVNPRVEGSSIISSPNVQQQHDPTIQQPSTSGTSAASMHVAVSSHSRHTPSSSNVTTSQAALLGPLKRPRDNEEGSPIDPEEYEAGKSPQQSKRLRLPGAGNDTSITDSGADIEYQVPTSSQRDQEDDVVVVDSDDDEGMAEADDGPIDMQQSIYDDSYGQEQDMDENECPEVNEGSIPTEANNEVEVVEERTEGQGMDVNAYASNDPSTSQASTEALAYVQPQQQDYQNQQSQAISSGSCEQTDESGQDVWKQQSPSHSRQQKSVLMMTPQGVESNVAESQEDPSINRPTSRYNIDNSGDERNQDNTSLTPDVTFQSSDDNRSSTTEDKTSSEGSTPLDPSGDDAESVGHETRDVSGTAGVESQQGNNAAPSESEVQQNQVEGTSDEIETPDGVTSEGERQFVEDTEEEGREAEASTSPSVNTRSKVTRGAASIRRTARGAQRASRPTPIVWQESPGGLRSSPGHRGSANDQSGSSPVRGFSNQRAQRPRRMRRPAGNFGNMRYNP